MMSVSHPMVPLSDLCKVQSGYAFKSADWQPSGVPVVQIGNVRPRTIELDGCKFVAEEVAAKAARFRLRRDDILISMTGHIGVVGRVRHDAHIMLNQRVGRLEGINERLVEPSYLFQVLQSEDVREKLVKLGYGAAQPNISPKLIGTVEVPLPPLETQRRIAAILGANDDLIEVNRRRVAVLETMARGLFEEWFVRFRFPGHEQVLLLDTPNGALPQGWKWGEFSDLAQEVRETLDPNSVSADTPYVGLEHIPRRSTTLDCSGLAGEVDSLKSKFKRGDILFGKIRPYFHKVAWAPFDGIASTDAIIWRPKPDGSAHALTVASSDAFVAHSVQTSNGTKMPRANSKVLAAYTCAIPDHVTGQRFEAICMPLVLQSATLQASNERLTASRDLLLPRLISGQLSLEAAERELEDAA